MSSGTGFGGSGMGGIGFGGSGTGMGFGGSGTGFGGSGFGGVGRGLGAESPARRTYFRATNPRSPALKRNFSQPSFSSITSMRCFVLSWPSLLYSSPGPARRLTRSAVTSPSLLAPTFTNCLLTQSGNSRGNSTMYHSPVSATTFSFWSV